MARIIAFIIGVMLFIASLPVASIMLLEYVHDKRMDRHYKITDISKGEPPTSTDYTFNEQEIAIDEKPVAQEGYTDAWENKMAFSDLTFKVNDKEIDRLAAYPVRERQEGLNRYFGDIAYFLVEDKQLEETSFVLVLKRTNEAISMKPNGDLVGGVVPAEELQYTYHTVSHEGEVSSKDFGYSDRNALETKLLTKGYLASTSVGYYTDLWHGYPSLFFPFLYPLLTIIIGGVLMVVYRPFWRRKH